nr:hypothetical protein [bacterium]
GERYSHIQRGEDHGLRLQTVGDTPKDAGEFGVALETAMPLVSGVWGDESGFGYSLQREGERGVSLLVWLTNAPAQALDALESLLPTTAPSQ